MTAKLEAIFIAAAAALDSSTHRAAHLNAISNIATGILADKGISRIKQVVWKHGNLERTDDNMIRLIARSAINACDDIELEMFSNLYVRINVILDICERLKNETPDTKHSH